MALTVDIVIIFPPDISSELRVFRVEDLVAVVVVGVIIVDVVAERGLFVGLVHVIILPPGTFN